MASIVLLSLPILAVTGVGWAGTRTRLVAEGALDALNAFSFRFALPALLLCLIARRPLRQSFNPDFYTGYLVSGAIIYMSVLGTLRVVAERDLSAAGAHATTATVSNLGFLGPPLMLTFFGERGAGPLAMAILAEVMVLLSVGSVLMGANGVPEREIRSLILRGTLFNPIVVAIVSGAALAGTGLALPEAIARFLGFLGGAAGPAALFALGGALALQRLHCRTAVTACLITVAKLAVHPMVVWLTLGRMMRLDAFWVNVGVLLACLPSAGNIYVLAQRHNADPQAGLRRDSSVHDYQRGEHSVRGVARTRLERAAIRANANHGFNEYDCAGPELRRGGAPSGPFLNATIRTALSQIGPDIATPRPRTSYIRVGGGGPISTNL